MVWYLPKLTAIDRSLISIQKHIATLKENTFKMIVKEISIKFEC